MGITKFHESAKKYAPDAYRTIHLSEYKGQSVAVDVSGFIYKYKNRGDMWIDSFVYLIISLRRNKIHPIFVFDGKAPKEKNEEKKKRQDQRMKAIERIAQLETDMDVWNEVGEVSDNLKSEMLKAVPNALLLGDIVPFDEGVMRAHIKHLTSQILVFTDDDRNTLNDLIDKFGIQRIVAPAEAEAMCAGLYHSGHVAAVISNDSDVCAHGVGKFLYDINPNMNTCVEISYSALLEGFGMTSDEFLDFCIMCGTDYNDNIPKVGPVTSYNLIKKHHRIEDIPLDTSILNCVETRKLFKQRCDEFEKIISKTPDINELHAFLLSKKSRVQYETLVATFAKPVIQLVD